MGSAVLAVWKEKRSGSLFVSLSRQAARADYFGLEVLDRTDLTICQDTTESYIPYKMDVCDIHVVFDDDGTVGAFDLAFLLGAWGPNPNYPADLNNDDIVNAFDLALLLGAWGPCQ